MQTSVKFGGGFPKAIGAGVECGIFKTVNLQYKCIPCIVFTNSAGLHALADPEI